jgi:hypothetical protein
MRATIERNLSARDSYGGEAPADWQPHIRECPCHVWYDTATEIVDGRKTAVREIRKAIFPIGTDVTEADRLADVYDRTGRRLLFAGPLRIEAVGRRPDHLAATLEAVSG